jgi:2-hydroxychromene-2-carboxylate isomerase
MPRTFALAARTGVTLRMRPVLPMVMRGLEVPAAKRMYIMLDAKREAESVGLPFGRISDPVGAPVERGFSLYPFAVSQGRAADYLFAFCRAAFAEGVDTGSDKGLRHVVTRAGLSWDAALAAVDHEHWRAELEENRRVMLATGLWGVPSYRLRGGAEGADFCVWGQDRLWLVEAEIRRRSSAP